MSNEEERDASEGRDDAVISQVIWEGFGDPYVTGTIRN
jgi:hypothetical protein